MRCVYARSSRARTLMSRDGDEERTKARVCATEPENGAAMCRTGSMSIRPDSCGLLYAPRYSPFLLDAASPLSFTRLAQLCTDTLGYCTVASKVLRRLINPDFSAEEREYGG